MRLKQFKKRGLQLALATAAGVMACAVSAQSNQPMESLTGGHKLSAEAQDRIYVMDSVFNHLTESRVHIFDGANGKFLGMIPTSFNGHMQVSHDGKKIYTMTTYHERVTRGKRTDTVEVWDALGLTFEKEIVLPNNRIQGLNYRGMFRQSADGKLIILQNATPATSVAIVDLEKGEHVAELTNTAGCWSVNPLPNRDRSFTTICGDGTLLTIDLDANGQIASQHRSENFFSVKEDPIFITPGFVGNTAYFVSFYGTLYSADFTDEKVKFAPTWSLLNDEDRAQGWTPGGYNLIATHEKSNRLYVQMHPDGMEGTHKNPAAEIWVFDLASKKRIARVPGMDVLSLSVDQAGNRLLGIDGGNVHIFDISEAAPKHIRTIENAGDAAIQAEPHPVVKGG